MTSRYSETNSVLARKVRGPKMRLAGFPAMDPLCHAFASLTATRTRSELRPGVDVTVYGFEVMRHGDYLRGLYAPSAIHTLAFPGGGGAGMVKAHPRLLSQVLDLYLGGAGTVEEEGFSRPLTAIDLSIYSRFVALVAECFDDAIRELCGRSAIGPGHPERFEQQPGMIRIASDRAEIFVIKLNFHIADSVQGAGLDFVIPVAMLELLKRDLIAAQNAPDSSWGLWRDHMISNVLDLRLRANCVIPLGRYSVAELNRLEQGSVLELPDDALSRVELRVRTRQGDVTLADARLGSSDRHKAVRLGSDPDAAFLAPLHRALGAVADTAEEARSAE